MKLGAGIHVQNDPPFEGRYRPSGRRTRGAFFAIRFFFLFRLFCFARIDYSSFCESGEDGRRWASLSRRHHPLVGVLCARLEVVFKISRRRVIAINCDAHPGQLAVVGLDCFDHLRLFGLGRLGDRLAKVVQHSLEIEPLHFGSGWRAATRANVFPATRRRPLSLASRRIPHCGLPAAISDIHRRMLSAGLAQAEPTAP